MKNIELTEKHKSKLLEMCNKLFWNGCINKCDFNELGILFIALDKNYKYNHKILKIHWFEFCMTYLLDKLHPDNDKQSKDNWSMDLSDKDYVILKIILRKKHPVDYLYEAFKKLK